MGGHLVEFDSIEESQDVIAGLMSDPNLKGKNFWTGGLNPGLLWIWSSSARPVHQDTKQSVIGDGRLVIIEYLENKIFLDINDVKLQISKINSDQFLIQIKNLIKLITTIFRKWIIP